MPPDQIIGAPSSSPPAAITLAWASVFSSARMPIAARSCWIAWAMRGLGSVFMANSSVSKPSAKPASASSALAFSGS